MPHFPCCFLFINVSQESGFFNIQIMNVYECNGKNIFMCRKMECSNQRGEADWIETLHLSPNENVLAIERMKTFIISFI